MKISLLLLFFFTSDDKKVWAVSLWLTVTSAETCYSVWFQFSKRAFVSNFCLLNFTVKAFLEGFLGMYLLICEANEADLT